MGQVEINIENLTLENVWNLSEEGVFNMLHIYAEKLIKRKSFAVYENN